MCLSVELQEAKDDNLDGNTSQESPPSLNYPDSDISNNSLETGNETPISLDLSPFYSSE